MTGKIEYHRVTVFRRLVRYQAMGEGEPLLLIHGLSGSTRWWRPVLAPLAAHARVYLLNLPGFGSLMHHAPPLPLTTAAAWIEAWADAVGIGRMDVMGHSMGGYIAVRVAAQTRDLVHRLVLVDAAGVPTTRWLPGYMFPMARAATQMVPEFVPVLTADAMRAGPWNIFRAAMDLHRQDVRRYLAAVQAPTLIVWGRNDMLVPLSAARVLHAGIAGSELHIIPGAGHVPMYDRPWEFANAVLEFLRQGSDDQAAV